MYRVNVIFTDCPETVYQFSTEDDAIIFQAICREAENIIDTKLLGPKR